jgi:hypothetical protein
MALILKPRVETQVINTFKPPAKPVVEPMIIEGFKPPPRQSYESISDIIGEEKVVAAKTIKVGKLNAVHESESAPAVTEMGLKKQPIVSEMFKPKPVERKVNKIVIVPRQIEPEIEPEIEKHFVKQPSIVDKFKPKVVDEPLETKVVKQRLVKEKVLSFSQLRNMIEKQSAATNDLNSGLMKPKYIKDKSVFYKNSGYLKDLLGEQ